MTIKEAEALIKGTTPLNHDKKTFLKCAKVLRNNPEVLINYVSIITLYNKEVEFTAISNILNHNFESDKQKILQLELLSSFCYSGSYAKSYLPIILPNERSIAFEIEEDDFDLYSMLLNHLPKHYTFEWHTTKNKRGVVSIYAK